MASDRLQIAEIKSAPKMLVKILKRALNWLSWHRKSEKESCCALSRE
jgi:hypothetical protein